MAAGLSGVDVVETGIDSIVATMSFQEDPTASNCLTGVVGGVATAGDRADAFLSLASANLRLFSSKAAKRCSRL